ncbi:hypothetical protein D9756_007722 [Leucocoprinus leucothites]|uniref:Spindle pole body component n=1 Tax=Leucocoprinus leucothites TaxID=201217 RepID=A0A8H5FW16_9AGAR|nr:hypothetical protein D9756_007722 [Leucoagaricus leucothites]
MIIGNHNMHQQTTQVGSESPPPYEPTPNQQQFHYNGKSSAAPAPDAPDHKPSPPLTTPNPPVMIAGPSYIPQQLGEYSPTVYHYVNPQTGEHVTSLLPPNHPEMACLQEGGHITETKYGLLGLLAAVFWFPLGIGLCLLDRRTLQSPLWFRLNNDDLANSVDELSFKELPPLLPHFFVPSLQDKPQNPIVERLGLPGKNRETKKDPTTVRTSLPPELHIITDDLVNVKLGNADQQPEDSIWHKLDVHGNSRKSRLLSWDALRPINQMHTSTPFLSERDSLVYASARYHVQPRMKDSSTHIMYTNQRDLFSSLKMTVLGNTSIYHSWDAALQRFVQARVKEGERGILLLDGMDEVISDRSATDGPTIHAFAHALANILDWLRKGLAKCPPLSTELLGSDIPISRFSRGTMRSCMSVPDRLYGHILRETIQEESKTPQEFHPFDYSPINLLSHIHAHLDTHLVRQSPREITAILAYVLSTASHEYLRQIAQSVGYGPQPPQKQERIINLALDEYTMDEDAEGGEEDIFEVLEKVDDDYPSFFPPELLAILPAARRSLVLLQKAQPEHPLLSQPARQAELRWIWRTEDIEAAYLGIQKVYHGQYIQRDEPGPYLEGSAREYKPGLEGLKIFDMEPGSSFQNTIPTSKATPGSVQDFTDYFPKTLPPITPTLSHLTSVVFSDLVRHSSKLSSTLLELFLDHPGELNFRSHLVLLRDFLLLTSSPFKLKLSFALFSDNEDYEIDNKNRTLSLQTLRQRKQITESTQPWAIGLASALLEREIWPPVGADLSFFLRTVIVDSLEYPQGGDNLPKQVVTDASWRLGFAIRDLPTGPGRDKWLNPLCVEALDFLYMDYKPPHPLEVLIPHEVLSKYQRMFTFLLRLIRIEHALHAVQRILRSITAPIFPTLTPARKLTLHFRFVAQSFMNALSSYVFDTVIGGNFNPFLAELVLHHNEDGTQQQRRFSDVFELAKRHSNLLDDILSACLMRSGQRAAGDLLRQTTEIVLEFSVLIGELRRGRLQEYEAASLVEDLYGKFRAKMAILTKVLKGLVEKSTSRSYAEHFFIGQTNLPGGLEALHHLLLRIDTSEWWTSTSNQA